MVRREVRRDDARKIRADCSIAGDEYEYDMDGIIDELTLLESLVLDGQTQEMGIEKDESTPGFRNLGGLKYA